MFHSFAASLHRSTRPHPHPHPANDPDLRAEALAPLLLGYLGSLQQDLPLLLLLPLPLQPIQLLQELELRADVADLLVPPVLLWGGGGVLKRRQGALNQ